MVRQAYKPVDTSYLDLKEKKNIYTGQHGESSLLIKQVTEINTRTNQPHFKIYCRYKK